MPVTAAAAALAPQCLAHLDTPRGVPLVCVVADYHPVGHWAKHPCGAWIGWAEPGPEGPPAEPPKLPPGWYTIPGGRGK